MLIKPASNVRSSEITPKQTYLSRRDVIRAATVIAATATGAGVIARSAAVLHAAQPAPHGRRLEDIKKSPFSVADEKPNSWEQITTYNNFYEFGTDKESPSLYAGKLKTEPWKVAIEGECAKPASYQFEDLIKGIALEERIYRHRCVEAWSMVIPWVGFPLSEILKKAEPNGNAKYVQFKTAVDPGSMVGVRQPVLRWPYTEGLRIDEATHPLTIAAVGLYGEVMPKQDGAPIRLVVPWKYGFKNIKSIVRIKFLKEQPLNTWQAMQPSEYGFYSNVNPTVDHPRWTQASERRIGEFLRRKTLMFNGYGDQVGSLYSGMDLKKNY